MDLMEGVEEIPNPVLAAGLTWEWESFPEFMDALERRERAIDIAAQAAHLPLRVYVMGDRAIRREPATAGRHRRNAPPHHRGAATSAPSASPPRAPTRTRRRTANFVPSRDADDHELLGIGSALGITGTGAFGMNSDFDDEDYELRWMRKLAKETGRPVWFLLTDRYEDPQRWRRLMEAVHEARAEGLPLTAQIAGRPIGVMMGIGTALNPFTVRPSYKALEHLPIEEQRRRLRDPQMRRQILAEKPSQAEVAKLAQFRQLITSRFDKFFIMGNPPDYEPGPEKSVAAIAQRDRPARPTRSPTTTIIEDEPVSLFPGGELHGGRSRADPRDAERSGLPARPLRRRRALHLDRRCRHAELHADALGPRPAPRTAPAAGAAGQAADQRDRRFLRAHRPRPARAGSARRLNLIDFDALQLHKPELVHDMPANGRRFVQRVEGYEATLVAGAPIFERGEHTGALPGKLVRAGRMERPRRRREPRQDIFETRRACSIDGAGRRVCEPVKAAAPASTAVNAALIEAARKEGKIALYSALDLALSEKIAKAFEATYQFPVRVERSGAERIFQRIAQEQTSRIRAVDLALSTDAAHFVAWKRNDWLAPYVPEDVARQFPADAIDADGTM